eukprot:TRINITY_DN149_c1_g1_i1.p2 TRINITY_DN149_c1_g1~~TRINITY_DN149_c1_g1_i1.p2  ORF type:complete len:214 (-),score=55.05 TRINITY_DN149_c1_g1_i1:1170-1718(-)
MEWFRRQFGDPSRADWDVISRWFAAVDKDGSGAIDATELQAALGSGGSVVDLRTASLLVKMFDKSGEGEISLAEFASLHRYLMFTRTTFAKYDTDRTGFLNIAQCRPAIKEYGLTLDEETFRRVMMAHDPELRGALSFQQFVEMVIFLGHLRNVFEWLDTDRDGIIQLRIADFIKAGTAIRK